MIKLPDEQLQAIADFWASQYQLEATEDQLKKFKESLKAEVSHGLQDLPWIESEPHFGSYLRKFITFVEYGASPVLKKSLETANLKDSIFSFDWKLCLSIDPGSVTVHETGEVVWQE